MSESRFAGLTGFSGFEILLFNNPANPDNPDNPGSDYLSTRPPTFSSTSEVLFATPFKAWRQYSREKRLYPNSFYMYLLNSNLAKAKSKLI